MDLEHAGDRTWRGRGAQADVKLLGGGAEVGLNREKVELRGIALAARGLHKKVIHAWCCSGGVGEQKPATAQRGEHGFRHASRELGGDDGIEGIASFPQHLLGRGSGNRVSAGDRT